MRQSKITNSNVKQHRLEGAEKRMVELSSKRKRQYKHVLESELEEGRSVKTAKRIAMATTNKTRSENVETKSSRK